MNNTPKNKPAIIFFAVSFLVVIIIMLLAQSGSQLKTEIVAPLGGVHQLYTFGNSLVAVSKDKQVSIWDWRDLPAESATISLSVDRAVLLVPDTLIWLPSGGTEFIEVRDLKSGAPDRRIQLPHDVRCTALAASSNGRFASVVAVNETQGKEPRYKKFRIQRIDADSAELSDVAEINSESKDLVPYDLAISDDGKLITVVGQKNGKGWIAMVDVERGKVAWEHVTEDSHELMDTAFAPDSKTVYTGGQGWQVYCFQSDSGELIRGLKMEQRQISANKVQHVPAITVSPDGSLVAAGTEPTGELYFWNAADGKLQGRLAIGHPILTGLAFSPDASTIAAAGVAKSQNIKIWTVPSP